MQEKMLRKEALPAFLKRVIGAAKTIAPVSKTGGFFMLEQVTRPEQVTLDYPLSYYSPKGFLLPPYETLLTYRQANGEVKVQPVIEAEEMILLGIHPCDINALWMLDMAFSKDNADAHYMKRREKITVIGVDCLKQCDKDSFCYDMKTNVAQGDYDLLLTKLNDGYFVRVGTERGAKLLGEAPDPASADRALLQNLEAAKAQTFARRIEYDTAELPARLDKNYDSPVWANIARRCYSCGSCNTVCPTCYCFNVVEKMDMNLTDGRRARHQDSCQLSDFAQVAGGESFRKERASRLRHRMFRKGKFIKEMFNRPGCVGCGRCNRACTSKISIIATFNELKGSL